MSLPVTCPSCAHHARVPSEFAGKPVRCPKCRAAFAVPSADAEAVTATPNVSGWGATEEEPLDVLPVPPPLPRKRRRVSVETAVAIAGSAILVLAAVVTGVTLLRDKKPPEPTRWIAAAPTKPAEKPKPREEPAKPKYANDHERIQGLWMQTNQRDRTWYFTFQGNTLSRSIGLADVDSHQFTLGQGRDFNFGDWTGTYRFVDDDHLELQFWARDAEKLRQAGIKVIINTLSFGRIGG